MTEDAFANLAIFARHERQTEPMTLFLLVFFLSNVAATVAIASVEAFGRGA